jgi:hypothetical protein
MFNLALCFLFCLLFGAFEGMAFGQEGVVVGKTKSVPGFRAGNIRAYQLDKPTPMVAGSISRSGKYSLELPPGKFALITSMFGKRGPVTKIAFASVKKGKRVTPRSPQAAAALSATAETRISVGNVLARGPQGQTYRNPEGRPITFDDILITDLVLAPKSCSVAVVEDRKFGRFQDVLKELRRQSSALFSEPIDLKAATKVLNANAPQFRITGSVGVLNDTLESDGTASMQIVDLKSGRVVASQELSGLPTSLETLFEAIAQRMLSQLCIPQRIQGTFAGIDRIRLPDATVDYEWQGSATLALQSILPPDPNNPSAGNIAFYALETANIDSYRKTGTLGGCQASVDVSQVSPQPPSTGAMLLYLSPVAGLGFQYDLSVALLNFSAGIETRICPNGTEQSPQEVTAELSVTSDAVPVRYAPSFARFTGSQIIGTVTMQWDFAPLP